MSQAQWQEMFQGVFTNGVMNGQLNGYVVTVTSGLGISVASGKAIIQGFYSRSDAAVPLTAGAADPTNPRIDLAVLHADLSAHTLTVQLLAGTPAPSPTPPALTQTSTIWEIALYQVRVNATQTVLTGGSLTDVRQYFGIGGVGIDYLASINAAQLWTPQSGVANWFEMISWSGANVEVPLGVGSGALAAAIAKTIMGGAGQFQQIASQPTAGSFGVPVIVAQALGTHVTVTTDQTLLSYTPSVTGYYRVSVYGHAKTNAGLPNVNLYVFYTDPNSGLGESIFLIGSVNTSPFAGVLGGGAVAQNQNLTVAPAVFFVNASTTMTVHYQATVATPSDFLSVFIERMA